MQITEVSLMRRRNLGNYEHIESSVTVALVEGDCADKAIELAKGKLQVALGLAPVAVKEEAPKKAPVKKKAPAKKEEKVVETVEAEVVEEAPKKKAPAKKKAEKKVVTKEEVLASLRAYAQAKKSKEMAKEVLINVTGKETLADVDAKMYGKLVKALEV